MIYQPLTSPDDIAGLTDSELQVLEALSHHVVDGRQIDPISLGALIELTNVSVATVVEGVSLLRHRGWVVCTGSIHLDREDRCLLLGEGLARASVIAAKRELALFEVEVGGRRFLISYEQHANSDPARSRWTARAIRTEKAGSPPLIEAEGMTREDARDALVDRLAASDQGVRRRP